MEEKKVRSSNIELLRIVAMLMIVIYHIVCHCVIPQLTDSASIERMGNGYFNVPAFYKKLLIVDLIDPWGQISNAIFILISGYFMVSKGKSVNLVKSAKKLFIQLVFSIAVLSIVSNVIFHMWGNTSFISMENFESVNGRSWYIGYYFVVILIGALFINEYLLKLDKKGYTIFLTVSFVITQFTWSAGLLNGFSSGLNLLLTGIFLYSLGGFIRKYDSFRNVRLYVYFLIILVLNIFICVSNYNVTMTNIEVFNRDTPDGIFYQSVISYDNSNFIVLVIAVCIFEIFRRIKMPNSRIINFIGAGTFMVYLVHDNKFFYSLWGMKDWIVDIYNTPYRFMLDLLKWGLATFAAGLAVYILYLAIAKVFEKTKWIFYKKV